MCKAPCTLFVAAVTLFAGVVQAQQRSGSWVDELGTIDAQIQILQKRDQLRVQQEANSKGCLVGLPKVSSIASFAGRHSALLIYPGGQVSEAEVGDQVTATAQVQRIEAKRVQVALRCGASQSVVSLDFSAPVRTQNALSGAAATESADAPLPAGSLRPSAVVLAPSIRLDMPLPPVPAASGAR